VKEASKSSQVKNAGTLFTGVKLPAKRDKIVLSTMIFLQSFEILQVNFDDVRALIAAVMLETIVKEDIDELNLRTS